MARKPQDVPESPPRDDRPPSERRRQPQRLQVVERVAVEALRMERCRVVRRREPALYPNEEGVHGQDPERRRGHQRQPPPDPRRERRVAGRERQRDYREHADDRGDMFRPEPAEVPEWRVRCQHRQVVRRRETGRHHERQRKRRQEALTPVTAQESGEAEDADGYDAGDVEEGGQPDQDPRDGRKEPVAVDVRADVGEHPGEHQGLEKHLDTEIAGEPHLRDVHSKKRGARERGAPAEQGGPGQVDGEHAEHAPEPVHVAGAGEPVRLVRDRDPYRIQVRELADYRAGLLVEDEEPEEP